MKNLYLELLYKEYQERLGIQNNKIDFQSSSYLNYLKEIKRELEIYKQCLKDSHIYNNIVLELDKGNVDSILDYRFPNIILTSFKDTFSKNIKGNLIIDGILKEHEKGILIQTNEFNKNIFIPKNNGSYAITHNPFDFYESCTKLEFLYEHGFNVVMGMLGNFNDKNYYEKIDKLKTFQQLVSGTLVEKNVGELYIAFVKTKSNNK